MAQIEGYSELISECVYIFKHNCKHFGFSGMTQNAQEFAQTGVLTRWGLNTRIHCEGALHLVVRFVVDRTGRAVNELMSITSVLTARAEFLVRADFSFPTCVG
jgi:hypothetical protein